MKLKYRILQIKFIINLKVKTAFSTLNKTLTKIKYISPILLNYLVFKINSIKETFKTTFKEIQYKLKTLHKKNSTVLFLKRLGLGYYFFCLLCPILGLLYNGLKVFIADPKTLIGYIIDPVVRSSLFLTFQLAFVTSIINIIFGFLVAWVLIRYDFLGKSILEGLIDLPISIPSSVSGLAIISLYNKGGFVGRFLYKFGIELAYTKPVLILSLLFICLPFTIRTLEPSIKGLDKSLEEMSRSLGSSKFLTFRRLIFPVILPTLITSFTLSFSRALGEYGSLVIVSSNMPYKDLVASVLIFQSLEQYEYPKATAIAVLLLLFSFFMNSAINYLQLWNKNRYR